MKIGFTEEDRKIIAICGASAVCAAAFQSPIGARLSCCRNIKEGKYALSGSLSLYYNFMFMCHFNLILKFT